MEKQKRAMDLINATDDNVGKVKIALQALSEERGWGHFAIFYASREKNHYVQCAGERGKTTLHCEAVANDYLKPAFKLSESQLEQLRAIGWKPPIHGDPNYSNFHRDLEAANDESQLHLAREIMRTLEVYGFPPNKKLDLELNLE